MAEDRRQLLTIGAFFIVLVVALLLAATQVISWWLFGPVVLVLLGVWMMALAAIRSANQQKYARSPFSTVALGVTLIVVGGAWGIVALGQNWIYALALILLACAAIAIAAALKRK
jgi:hypothetical protein